VISCAKIYHLLDKANLISTLTVNSKKGTKTILKFKGVKENNGWKHLENPCFLRKVECIALTFAVNHLTPLGFELLSISENELPVCSVLIICPLSIIAVVEVSPA